MSLFPLELEIKMKHYSYYTNAGVSFVEEKHSTHNWTSGAVYTTPEMLKNYIDNIDESMEFIVIPVHDILCSPKNWLIKLISLFFYKILGERVSGGDAVLMHKTLLSVSQKLCCELLCRALQHNEIT